MSFKAETAMKAIGSLAAMRELPRPRGIDSGGLGMPHSRMFSHWFNVMDLQLTARSSTAAAVPERGEGRVIEPGQIHPDRLGAERLPERAQLR